MNVKLDFDGKMARITIVPMQPGEKAMLEAFKGAEGEIRVISSGGDELSILKQVPKDVPEGHNSITPSKELGTLREVSFRR